MSVAEAVQTTANPQSSGTSGLLLQRKCACGSSRSSLAEMCVDCQSRVMQRKLAIGANDDPLEREADRIAEAVLAAPAAAAIIGAAPRIQRSAGRAGGKTKMAPASVEQVLADSGRPLDPALRQDMEQRFGHDFSRVRVHADARAADSARSVHALAYTAGQDVVFGAGQYAPGSMSGRQLLAHELAHVVQQGEIAPPVAQAGEAKRNAAATPAAAGIGKRPTVRPVIVGCIQRQPESDPPTFPDFPGLIGALEEDVGKNLLDYGHHLYQASLLHPDEPHYLENALTRYALGLNVLKTGFRFGGIDQDAADTLALGTGILFKGLTFVQKGEFVLDYQMDIGKGLKLETNIDLGVNPDDYTDVRKAGVSFSILSHF